MTSKSLTWVAIIVTIAVLAVPNVFAIDKNSDIPQGIPPRTVADYLRAVIMAHRHFYTIHIVNRLEKERIVDATENWQATHSLPLPVQLLQETSEMVELTSPNVRYRLISQWPINKDNAPANEFERMALKEVQIHPNRPYSSTIGVGERQVFQAVYADVAVSTVCVQCHNSHPNSPKSDFKIGDVIGGLLISFPLSNQ
ncbi:MAG: DUF3365 domain-containing protein [Nitrospirales bacterium]